MIINRGSWIHFVSNLFLLKVSSGNGQSIFMVLTSNQYVQTSRGKVDNDCLNILRRFHTMRSIQDDVQQEVGSFSSPCNRPEAVVEHPTATQIAVLQEFLYCRRYNKIREPYGMSANELAMVCVDRWISSDHICWLMKILNQDQDETFFVYLNGISKDPATLQRFTKCSSKPSKLCFAINVCKNQTGQTFIGSDFQPGNHWSLCHVDTTEKRIVYADSLGWAIPANLLNKLDRYIKAINEDLNVAKFTLSTTHNPNSKSPIRGGHKCNQT